MDGRGEEKSQGLTRMAWMNAGRRRLPRVAWALEFGAGFDRDGPDVLQTSQMRYKTNTSNKSTPPLTKRERQIMDVLYKLGRATATDIRQRLDGTPSDSTVRTQLRVLETKGHVRHEEQGLRFVFMPTVPRHSARRSALRHVVDTFFDGSAAKAVAALLGGDAARISDDDLQRIARLVEDAREGTR
jgi:predicted transcriptional regulator